MKRIESFKTFSQLQTQLKEEARQKEIASKREASTTAFNELLSKYGAASISDLNEEDRANFMKELEEGNAFSAARAKAIADGEKEFTVNGETYPVEDVDKEDKENAEEFVEESEEIDIDFDSVEERNAFIFAAAQAKKDGKKRFTFNGKTYPVTLKVDLLK